MSEIKIRMNKGFDAHCHFRTGEMMLRTAKLTSAQYSRAVAMPNTIPPIETADQAKKYRDEIRSICSARFEPIMTIMLTRRTTPKIVREAANCGVKALKYIPKGVSVNSEESISLTELPHFYHVLEAVQKTGMVFSGHWELLNNGNQDLPEIERESAAICFLDKIVKKFPDLKIVVEHASTRCMIDYLKFCPPNVRATLTVHHALIIYDRVCNTHGVIENPYNYCKPIAKQPWDVVAVTKAMVSGDPRFFFGSDNAPHPNEAKMSHPPKAGIFNPFTLCMLCQIFEKHNALANLHKFISAGEMVYELPPTSQTIELVKKPFEIPSECHGIVPFMAGKTVDWQIVE